MSHNYNGNWTWDQNEETCTGVTTSCASINPEKTSGIICTSEGGLRRINSTDGKAWTEGSDLPSSWNRGSPVPSKISVAWNDSQEWLYVSYNDRKIYGAAKPYTNPQLIDVGEPVVYSVGVNLDGNYMVISVLNSSLDLYELTGSGSNWSGNTLLSINTGTDENYPVIGEVDGHNALAYNRDTDIWGSQNGEVSIESSSLGQIKVTFR
ncbi:hypothetical protein ACFLZS_01425 [Patescibacteria group bacterium]